MTDKEENPLETLDPDDPRVAEDVRKIAHSVARKFGEDSTVAEDIAQTAMVILLRDKTASHDYREVDSRKAYLWKVILNIHHKQWRRSGAGLTMSIDDSYEAERLSYESDVEQQIVEKEKKLILSRLMKQLSDDERTLLRLLVLNYNQKEIALLMGISHSNSRKKLSLLKYKLAEKIEELQNS